MNVRMWCSSLAVVSCALISVPHSTARWPPPVSLDRGSVVCPSCRWISIFKQGIYLKQIPQTAFTSRTTISNSCRDRSTPLLDLLLVNQCAKTLGQVQSHVHAACLRHHGADGQKICTRQYNEDVVNFRQHPSQQPELYVRCCGCSVWQRRA